MPKTKNTQTGGDANVKKKSRKTIKKKRTYTDETLRCALNEIRPGKPLRDIAEKYDIPLTTLFKKSHNYTAIGCKKGPATTLSEQEETDVASWIKYRAERGFPVTKTHLIDCVQNFLNLEGRQTIFKNNRPGDKWYKGYLKRHPDLSIRVSQSLTATRAGINDECLDEWFRKVKVNLERLKLIPPTLPEEGEESEEIKKLRRRYWNGDEVAFRLNPESDKVIAEKGAVNVHNLVGSDEKGCVTILITVNANGERAPPYIIFAGQRLPPKSILAKLPMYWSFGLSESGWMFAENFYCYVTNSFYPYLLEQEIEFPVTLFVDNHSSHVTMPLAQFCESHQIELVPLYPNATHFLQPCDTSLFRPLKAKYKELLLPYRIKNEIIHMKKELVPDVVEAAMNAIDFAKIVKSGFKACGLFPLNREVVESNVLLKCKKKQSRAQNSSNTSEVEVMQTGNNVLEPAHDFLTFFQQKFIDPDMLQGFQSVPQSSVNTEPLTVNREALFQVWCALRRMDGLSQALDETPPSSNNTSSEQDLVQDSMPNSAQELSDDIPSELDHSNLSSIGEFDFHISQDLLDMEISMDFENSLLVHPSQPGMMIDGQNHSKDSLHDGTDGPQPQAIVIVSSVPGLPENILEKDSHSAVEPQAGEKAAIDSNPSNDLSMQQEFVEQPLFDSESSKDISSGQTSYDEPQVHKSTSNVGENALNLCTKSRVSEAQNITNKNCSVISESTELGNSVLNEIQNTSYSVTESASISVSGEMIPENSDESQSSVSSPFKDAFYYPNVDVNRKKDPKVPAAASLSEVMEYLTNKEREKKAKEENVQKRKQEREEKRIHKELIAQKTKAHQAEKKVLTTRKKDLTKKVEDITKSIDAESNEELKINLHTEVKEILCQIEEIDKILSLSQRNIILEKIKLKEN